MHKLVTVSNPGAGNNWAYTVPAGKCSLFKTGYFTFTASAAVANRLPRIILYGPDGTTPIFISPQETAVTANQVIVFSFGEGVPYSGTTSPRNLVIPAIPLLAGCKIGMSTALLDAGDAYTGIFLWVDENDADEFIRSGNFIKL